MADTWHAAIAGSGGGLPTVGGFEVEVDTPELPEDYVCPVCGVGPDEFEAVEE